MPCRLSLLALIMGLCTVALVLGATVPSGMAAGQPLNLWVSDRKSSEPGEPAHAEIACWYSKQDRFFYLFLPSMMNASRLYVHFDQEEPILIDGVSVRNGGVSDAFVPGRSLQVETRKGNFQVRVLQSANLPALWVVTQSGSLNAIHAKKTHKEPSNLLMLNADGRAVYRGNLQYIKSRGEASFRYAKKPYQIKLEKSADLLGTGKAKKWILLAMYNDYSLLRNKLTFEMAEAAGLPYTVRSGHVDLYLNREYRGTYLLCEKIEIGTNRIPIQDLEKATETVNESPLSDYSRFGSRQYAANTAKGHQIPIDPEDISGGYLIELDYPHRYKDDPSGFVTARGQAVNIKEPKYASKAQVETIQAFMQSFENALFAPTGVDSVTGKHYSEFVDMDSLVRKYLIEEISKNYDTNRSSHYYYKPEDARSPLAFAGPVWDYDSAYSNYNPQHSRLSLSALSSPLNLGVATDSAMRYFWWPAAYKRHDFRQAVADTYHQVYMPLLCTLLGLEDGSDRSRLLPIDAYAAQIDASAQMNRSRWPFGSRKPYPLDNGKTPEENVSYLKDFLQKRMDFLSELWTYQQETR